MGIPTRIMTEPTAKQLADANLSNLEVAKQLLSIAEHVDPATKEGLMAAVTKVVTNTNTISRALLSAPSGR